jgi:predicted extracellular nuclease
MLRLTLTSLLALLALMTCTTASQAQVPGLIISEYHDGPGEDNAIEIFNCTGAPVHLGDYFLRIRFKDTPGVMLTAQLTAGSYLPSGETWVITDYDASPALQALADQTSTLLDFDGDDAITLSTWNGSTYPTIDSIGQWDVDPGTGWSCGLGSTQGSNMRRMPSVSMGDTDKDDSFDPCLEWDFFDQNDISNLGYHSAVCDGVVSSEDETWGSLKAMYR